MLIFEESPFNGLNNVISGVCGYSWQVRLALANGHQHWNGSMDPQAYIEVQVKCFLFSALLNLHFHHFRKAVLSIDNLLDGAI